ncbi:glycosyltransferase family 2 protein [Haloarcula sp. S1CR25-12]|uniref:Glycosyltransferase family 2 protein n=1 Tax=Haloarcula saliterrae TaxID=2950534 RepID=A0ABU2FGZ2_9EURY|nr:glycosyltransferase family 2 protein [Haloarcula sp. S1CR25-12]MDS0261506.1 glycosyltransferase family 2 protein [Haloarcula sp. S1CR25-12]
MRSVAVIPAYNEASTIGPVIDDTGEYVDRVVVVDDGSSDDTADIARAHGATVVEHVFNTGVGGAVRTGYQYAIKHDYDWVVQVDADGQHDPSKIPELLDVAGDYDMVIASRYLNESYQDYSATRNAGIQFFTRLVNALGDIEITDVTSGFRVYRVSMLAEILHRSDKHWAIEQTLEAAKGGYRITEVSTKMPTRDEGESQFTIDTFALYPIRMTDTILRVLLFR